MSAAAVLYRWDGEAMVPQSRFDRHCSETFVVGQVYSLDEAKGRSRISHDHFFAQVADVWQQLPDDLATQYPNAEVLRKKCLIKAGYCDKRSIVCASKAEAARVASFIRPLNDYAIVTVSEAVVTVYEAKSQSRKAMGGQVFQESKQKVLDLLDEMLGVDSGDTERHAGRAA